MKRGPKTKPIIGRLLEKIIINDLTGCWEWTAAKCRQGYGQIGIGKKTYKAHRASYEGHFGPIPDGIQVLHSCDNPSCINPDHLFLGTNDDNVADKLAKGRHRCPRGQEHALSKLTEADVIAIRDSSEQGKDIAERMGVACATVSQVRTRKTWKHVR